jgi:hypothetical protein
LKKCDLLIARKEKRSRTSTSRDRFCLGNQKRLLHSRQLDHRDFARGVAAIVIEAGHHLNHFVVPRSVENCAFFARRNAQFSTVGMIYRRVRSGSSVTFASTWNVSVPTSTVGEKSLENLTNKE